MRKKDRKSKVTGLCLAALATGLFITAGIPTSVHATQFIDTTYTVEKTEAVLYSCKGTIAYALPQFTAPAVTTINANLPVQVVGVTSNGWFQINLGTICYVPGYSLTQEPTGEAKVIYTEEQIQGFIKGTYAYYDYEKLVPGPIVYTNDELIQIIKNNQFDMSQIKAFKQKFFDDADGKSTKRFVEYLLNHAQ